MASMGIVASSRRPRQFLFAKRAKLGLIHLFHR
jgi:hypothetical protein